MARTEAWCQLTGTQSSARREAIGWMKRLRGIERDRRRREGISSKTAELPPDLPVFERGEVQGSQVPRFMRRLERAARLLRIEDTRG